MEKQTLMRSNFNLIKNLIVKKNTSYKNPNQNQFEVEEQKNTTTNSTVTQQNGYEIYDLLNKTFSDKCETCSEVLNYFENNSLDKNYRNFLDLISSGQNSNDFRKDILLHFKRACQNDITIEWPKTTAKPLDPPQYFRYKLTALLCLTMYPYPAEKLDVLLLIKSLQLDLGRLVIKKKDPGFYVKIDGLHPNSYKKLVQVLNNALDELSDGGRTYDEKVDKNSFF